MSKSPTNPSEPNDGTRGSAKPSAEEARRLEGLLETYLPGLRGFLNKRAPKSVSARESVDDLAQSACREAVEHIRDGRLQLRSDGEFKQWLYQAGLHKLQARARFHQAARRDIRREARPVNPVHSNDPGVDPATSATPSRFAATAESKERVHRAIAGMDERDQRVLTMAVLEGRSHREVAAELGIDVAHSRMVLSRAMAKLAKHLQE